MECRTYPLGALGSYRFVVIISRQGGKLLFSRHRERATWETQGGHIEPGETPLEAARRELYEESGATAFRIAPAFDYWAGEGADGANGMVFAAFITARGPLPESEMAEARLFDAPPEHWTYPDITPVLLRRLEGKRPQR